MTVAYGDTNGGYGAGGGQPEGNSPAERKKPENLNV